MKIAKCDRCGELEAPDVVVREVTIPSNVARSGFSLATRNVDLCWKCVMYVTHALDQQIPKVKA